MSEIDLKGIVELDKILIEKDKEIERLKDIIKEVREYIENHELYEQDYDYWKDDHIVEGIPSDKKPKQKLLEILGKVEEK